MNKTLSMVKRPTSYSNLIGFDELFDAFANRSTQTSYPPYNLVKKNDDEYTISMAVAGFSREDISVRVEEDTLVVEGTSVEDDEVNYIHRGIASRGFTRSWRLYQHLKVVEARMENGMLYVDLKREVPEALKPKQIEIR